MEWIFNSIKCCTWTASTGESVFTPNLPRVPSTEEFLCSRSLKLFKFQWNKEWWVGNVHCKVAETAWISRIILNFQMNLFDLSNLPIKVRGRSRHTTTWRSRRWSIQAGPAAASGGEAAQKVQLFTWNPFALTWNAQASQSLLGSTRWLCWASLMDENDSTSAATQNHGIIQIHHQLIVDTVPPPNKEIN